MDILGKVAGSAVRQLLQDPVVEGSELTSDRVGAAVSVNAAALDQQSVRIRKQLNAPKGFQDDFLSQSFSSQTAFFNPSKLVLIGKGVVDPMAARFSTVLKIDLPKAFYARNSQPAFGQTRYFGALRTGFYARVQVNVAAGIAGALYVFYVPLIDLSDTDWRTVSLPEHGLMNLGTTSVVEMEIPYTNDDNYVITDSGNLGSIYVIVWSPLKLPTGVTNSVTVQVLGSMIDLDLQNPRRFPSLQVKVRNKVDIGEGPGAMNLANFDSTGKSQSISLGMEETAVDHRTAGMAQPIDDFGTMFKIPTLIGTPFNEASGFFTWEKSKTSESALYEWNLTPLSMGPIFALFANSFRYWRGSLEFHITIFATPFNKGRLRIAIFPNMNEKFTFEEADNAINVFLDIGLDSTADIVLPFSSFSWLKVTGPLQTLEGAEVYGRLAIYVANELQTNTNTPPLLEGQITVNGGPDFEWIVPTTGTLVYQTGEESVTSNSVVAQTTEEGAAAAGLGALENSGGDQLAPKEKSPILNFIQKRVPIVFSNHTKTDTLFGRAMYIGKKAVGETPIVFKLVMPEEGFYNLLRMVVFFTGKLNVHLYNNGTVPAEVSHTWEGQYNPTEIGVSANGSIVIPAGELMSFQAPYYARRPVQKIADNPLGFLMGRAVGEDTPPAQCNLFVWISFNGPNFFTPRPFGKIQKLKPDKLQLSSAETDAHSSTDSFEIYHQQGGSGFSVLEESWAKSEMRILIKIQNTLMVPKPHVMMVCHVVLDALKPAFEENRLSISDTEIYEVMQFRLRNQVIRYPEIWEMALQSMAKLDMANANIFTSRLMAIAKIYDHTQLDVNHQHSPDVTTCQLVIKNRGLYDHYGIKIGEQVMHLASENILDSVCEGKATVITEEFSEDWQIVAEQDCTPAILAHIESTCGKEIQFSWDSNCETFARFAGLFPGIEQGSALVGFFGIIVAATALASSHRQGLMDVLTSVAKSTTDTVSSVAMRTYSLFTSACLKTISHTVSRTITRCVIRFGCYAILYCGNPTLLSTMALGTLAYMDLSDHEVLTDSVKGMVMALFEGDLCALAETTANVISAEMAEKDKEDFMRKTVNYAKTMLSDSPIEINQQQGLDGMKNFNVFSSVGRNLEWWLQKITHFFLKIKEWISPSETTLALDFLEEYTEEILQVITDAEGIIVRSKTASEIRQASFQEELKYQLARMQCLRRILVHSGVSPLRSLVTQMCTRLAVVARPCVEPTTALRVEPVGVWIHGQPGGGKSWFATQLQIEMAKYADRPLSVFTQPISEYFDGYAGQWIHYVDDLGQTRDELDVMCLVNLISSRHFALNMAAVEDKAYWYSSEVVMVTTNKGDFSSQVLNSTAALERRFPFVISLRAMRDYSNTSGHLDVTKAHADGTMKTGACWEVCTEVGQQWKTADIALLARNIVDVLKARKAVVDLYNQAVGPVQTTPIVQCPVDTNQVLKDLKDLVTRSGGVRNHQILDVLKTFPSHFHGGDDEDDGVYRPKRRYDGFSTKMYEEITSSKDRRAQLELDIQHMSDTILLDSDIIKDLGYPHGGAPSLVLRNKWTNMVSSARAASCKLRAWSPLVNTVLAVLGGAAAAVSIYYYISARKTPRYVDSERGSSVDLAVNDVKIVKVDTVQIPEVTTEQRAYAQTPRQARQPVGKMSQVKMVPKAVAAHQQSSVFSSSWMHLVRSCLTIRTGSHESYGVGFQGTSFFYFKHGVSKLKNTSVICWNGLEAPLGNFSVVCYSDATDQTMETELCVITCEKLPWRFRDMTQHIDLMVSGKDGKVCFSSGTVSQTFEVTKMKEIGVTVLCPSHVDLSTITSKSLDKLKEWLSASCMRYMFSGSRAGCCGGLLLQKVHGVWRMVGLHVGGNQKLGTGIGCHFLPWIKSRIPIAVQQGMIVKRERVDIPNYCPSKTTLVPSPYYGLTPGSKEPAVLHPKDCRLNIEIDNLVKKGMEKYCANVHSVDPDIFGAVVTWMKRRLYEVVGQCDWVDWDEAINGLDNSNPIDMNSSPGRKYRLKGKRKRDLFEHDGDCWVMKPEFAKEVSEKWYEFCEEGIISTEFATVLKDELRSTTKIDAGETRVIEACAVDYVVCYRKLMGQLYDRIYESNPLATGIAVGIDPMQGFHDLFCELQGHLYTVDFKQFDGRLSDSIMEEGVSVMAFCHRTPTLVEIMHECIVNSMHVVMDEIMEVLGGMPSGAPCTSVLNSICNQMMCVYAARMSGVPLDKIQIVCYGDDVLMSCQVQMDGEKFTTVLKESFGMVATDAEKKGPVREVTIEEATFLKRSFRCFPGTNHVVGVLDAGTILENIQWCHGIEEFKQQHEVWINELVLHGQEFYDSLRNACVLQAQEYGLFFPTFEDARVMVWEKFFT